MKQTPLAFSTLIALSAAAATKSDTTTPICGSKGYDTVIEGYYYGNEDTYSKCSAACKKENCVSLSVGNGECNLYHVAVAGNFEPISDSPYAFYDASCSSSATSTTSKTSGALSSTTRRSSTSTSKTTTKTNASLVTSTSKSTTKSSTTTSKSASTTGTTKSTSTTKSTTTSKSTTLSKPSTKASSTTSKVSTASSSTTPAAASPPCPLPTFTVTDFVWFNSSHNAACAAGRPDVGDGTGCLDENGNWCDPNLDKKCFHCGIGVCMTGLPTQPVGYGPADYVKAEVSNIGDCYQSDPGTTPRRAVGDGEAVRCGGSQYQMSFLGDSNVAKSVAYFNFQNQYYCSNTKAYYTAYGSGNTSMSCTYDSGRNATCKLDKPSFDVAATRFDNVGYYN